MLSSKCLHTERIDFTVRIVCCFMWLWPINFLNWYCQEFFWIVYILGDCLSQWNTKKYSWMISFLLESTKGEFFTSRSVWHAERFIEQSGQIIQLLDKRLCSWLPVPSVSGPTGIPWGMCIAEVTCRQNKHFFFNAWIVSGLMVSFHSTTAIC